MYSSLSRLFIAFVCALVSAELAERLVYGGESPSALQFREIKIEEQRDGKTVKAEKLADVSTPLPSEAVKVFPFAGSPIAVRINDNDITVDYRWCGVRFDRTTGVPILKLTCSDGWPEKRPSDFPPQIVLDPNVVRYLGPGIAAWWWSEAGKDVPSVEISTEFEGKRWLAVQHSESLKKMWGNKDWLEKWRKFGYWTFILRALHENSCVTSSSGGVATQKYTVADGLPGNIVTHLVAAQDALWAACVDIYEPDKGEWGIGGLGCYKDGKWRKIESIDGHPVRWVTLLQTIGNDLWVGFREGSGVAGDAYVYGMGIYPGVYRPHATAIVLARLKDGKWTIVSRPPAEDIIDTDQIMGIRLSENQKESPTEFPVRLVVSGEDIFLMTLAASTHTYTGNWNLQLGAHLSRINLDTKEWKILDAAKDFSADELTDIADGKGEILVLSNIGLHRWKAGVWTFMDPQTDISNPSISAMSVVENDLWIGYNKLKFGVYGEQGLSRYREDMEKWEHIGTDKLGTACPVIDMAALSGGQLWVYFHPRISPIPFNEFDFYLRERSAPRHCGVGCFKGTTWTFPVKIDDLQESDYFQPSFQQAGLIAIRDKLFVATPKGLYVGPSDWKKLSESMISQWNIEDNGHALTFSWFSMGDDILIKKKSKYDIDTSNNSVIESSTLTESEVSHSLQQPFDDVNTKESGWVEVPVKKEGRWAIGPLAGMNYRIRMSPTAVWIAGEGEVIRLDRKLLVDWFGR